MRWYRENGRHTLPWRQARDPYSVLVSEVMLQQTQVARVLGPYARWISRWPTVSALAKASGGDVVREWASLGYNRRAINLLAAAQEIERDREGRFPTDQDSLRSLPGVGEYTASAIVSFALEGRVAVLDTNVSRVLARSLAGVESQAELSSRELRRLAERILPRSNTRAHNLALMDLGAIVCKARQPTCMACPIAAVCRWNADRKPQQRGTGNSSPRFEDTSRFARGRIVQALRDHAELTTEQIQEMVPAQHRPRVEKYLRGLVADGLIEPAWQGGWRLPQGSSNIASPKL